MAVVIKTSVRTGLAEATDRCSKRSHGALATLRHRDTSRQSYHRAGNYRSRLGPERGPAQHDAGATIEMRGPWR